MIEKIRHKIIIGILLLTILLGASGGMVIYQFHLLNKSVSSLIEDNYKTIQACQGMLDALEREDSGILLLSLGKWKDGRRIINEADSIFAINLKIANDNLTEPNEDIYLDRVKSNYQIYKSKWEQPIAGTMNEGNIEWYIQEINNYFLQTKNLVNELMVLNQQSMFEEASLIRDRSYRAIMPGIVTIVALLIFAFVFNFFLNNSLIRPLEKMTRSVKEHRVNLGDFPTNRKVNDEFKELEQGIHDLVARTKKFYEKG